MSKENQIQYVCTHKWIPDVKQRIFISLQPMTPEKLGNKENPKRIIYGLPRMGKQTKSPDKVWSVVW